MAGGVDESVFVHAFGKVAGVDVVRPPKELEPDKEEIKKSVLSLANIQLLRVSSQKLLCVVSYS
uniref:Uncharacterized protein n=1 Tax=Oryza nivara TaxID=4536 RepID=A0A0E0IG41_ORYNI